MSTTSEPIVWTPGGNRIWWACPACKVEAGVTLPVSVSEVQRRLDAFQEEHSACNITAQEGKAWRG